MKKSLALVSWLLLDGMLVSSALCAGHILNASVNRLILLAGTIGWFVIAPLWMKRPH